MMWKSTINRSIILSATLNSEHTLHTEHTLKQTLVMLSRAAALLGLAASAAAFMPTATPALASVARPATTSLRMAEAAASQRFNTMIELDSPKVATQVCEAARCGLAARARAAGHACVHVHVRIRALRGAARCRMVLTKRTPPAG